MVIAGPTAVGKTRIAIDLAKRYRSVIVSADSRQVFSGMRIGTARPTPEEEQEVPHFLVGHVAPGTSYSAGAYARECTALLDTLFAEHDIVFLVGGSGLYLRAVLEGFDDMPAVPAGIRQKWIHTFETQGIEALQHALQERDPVYAPQVDLQNPHRLIRALSVMEASGKLYSDLRRRSQAALPFHVMRILCNLPRPILYDRIHRRVDVMMTAGLLDEVRSLLPYRHTQVMQTVGYRELIASLDGAITLEEAVVKIKQHTCNYAKRQLTWFRHQGDWNEFNPPDTAEIAAYIDRVMST